METRLRLVRLECYVFFQSSDKLVHSLWSVFKKTNFMEVSIYCYGMVHLYIILTLINAHTVIPWTGCS